MNSKLFGVAAVICSVSILLLSFGMFNLMIEYSNSFRREAELAEKSAYIVDSIATTVFLKMAEKDKEISPEAAADIKKDLAKRSERGYIFEKFLMAWNYNAKKKEDEKTDGDASEDDDGNAADEDMPDDESPEDDAEEKPNEKSDTTREIKGTEA